MAYELGEVAGMKFDDATIAEMRARRAEGWTQGQIARAFQCSIGHVGRILRDEVRLKGDKPLAQDFDAFMAQMPSVEDLLAMQAQHDAQAAAPAVDTTEKVLEGVDDPKVKERVSKYLTRE